MSMIKNSRLVLLSTLAMLLMIAIVGCTKKIYVPVERVSVRTDSTAIEQLDSLRNILSTKDSVIQRDSVVLIVKGDTVTKEVWKWRERVSIIRDTIHATQNRDYTKVLRDTVREPYLVEVEKIIEVERKPSTIEKTLKFLGWTFIGLVVLVISFYCIRSRLFKKQ